MSNQIASFASGSNLYITIGDTTVAYGTNLSFTDDVSHGAIGGVGSYSYDSLEPLQYLARGSFSLIRYTDKTMNGAKTKINGRDSTLPSRVDTVNTDVQADGNSMLNGTQFNPAQLLMSRTFDINIYEKETTLKTPIFTLRDCRMTSYSITFNPGSLISENISFICIRAEDRVAGA